jgi:hypothetical protein
MGKRKERATMKIFGIILLLMLFIGVTVLIDFTGQSNLDRRIAAGDKITSPICAVNLLYDQQCGTISKE